MKMRENEHQALMLQVHRKHKVCPEGLRFTVCAL